MPMSTYDLTVAIVAGVGAVTGSCAFAIVVVRAFFADDEFKPLDARVRRLERDAGIVLDNVHAVDDDPPTLPGRPATLRPPRLP